MKRVTPEFLSSFSFFLNSFPNTSFSLSVILTRSQSTSLIIVVLRSVKRASRIIVIIVSIRCVTISPIAFVIVFRPLLRFLSVSEQRSKYNIFSYIHVTCFSCVIRSIALYRWREHFPLRYD